MTRATTTGRVPLRGGCQVWWARVSDAADQLRDLLDAAEAERWQRFRHDDDRNRMLVGVALAKTVLGLALHRPPAGIVFDRTCSRCGQAHGKPRLTGPDAGLRFSVSHAGDRICVAVSAEAEVGVDVESLDRAPEPGTIAHAVLAGPELDRWSALPEDRRPAELIRAWTRKESLLKATGDGITLPMHRIELADVSGRPVLRAWPPDRPRPTAWLHDLAPGSGYLACLTVLGAPPAAVVERDGSGLL